MRVLFLPRHDSLAASCRHRVLQYIPHLREHGIDCTVVPFFSNAYVKRLMSDGRKSLAQYALSAGRRLKALASANRYDVIVIQSELFPFLPGVVESLLTSVRIPYVLDFDDAFFHQYDRHENGYVRLLFRNKIAKLIRNARLNLAGSAYLADYARACGGAVEVVPTVVDVERYPSAPVETSCAEFSIGWIGTPSTTPHLELVTPELRAFARARRAKLIAVGARPFETGGLPVEWVPWDESTEVGEIQRFDVGIMPLPDTPWTRGKCGFKLIQAMACWKPVVASPVGANCQVVADGRTGLLAGPGRWVEALGRLFDDPTARRQIGAAARQSVEQQYSLQVWASRLRQLLIDAARSRL